MPVKHLDPKLHTIIIASLPLPAKGYADGEFLSVERESDSFTDVVGTDGEVTRIKMHDKRATVTLTVMETSEINSILSTLLNLDENTDGGAGVGAFLVKNRAGTTLYAGDASWVAKGPDLKLDKTATTRAWKIRVANLKAFDGNT